jgi:hypothetical protein
MTAAPLMPWLELTKLLLQAAAGCDPRLAGHLTASAFLRFRRSPGGTVSAAAVHEYLARRAAMLKLVRPPTHYSLRFQSYFLQWCCACLLCIVPFNERCCNTVLHQIHFRLINPVPQPH